MTEDILLRHLAGLATPEEQRDVEAWRQQSAEHEASYQRLHDGNALQKAYRLRKSLDTQRALRDMQQRIRQRRQLSLWRTVAAVAVVLLVASVTLQLVFRQGDTTQASADIQSITPGTARATMVLASGERVPLSAEANGLHVTALAGQLRRAAAKSAPHGYTAYTAYTAYTGHTDSVPRNEIIVPRGGEFKVVLEDGTTVWLNADSRLYYPESFSGGERRVAVEGEAYFQVAHDEEKPFLVESAGQLVRVLGTEFNIQAFPDETQVLTTLVKGSIAMSTQDSPGSQLRLTPGHQATFSKQQRDIRVSAVDAEAVASWKDGVIVCTGQTLDQLMHSLSRWYDFDYTIADARLAKAEFVGQFTRYDNFDDVCQILEKSGGIRILRQGRKVRVEGLSQK